MIKVEPLHGDLLRLGAREGLSPLYANSNRGKRSLAVDVTRPAGRTIVLDLAR